MSADRVAMAQDVTLHEEVADIDAVERPAGEVRLTKRVESRQYHETVPRESESGEVERVAAEAGDTGEVLELPDGSVSIPILEEEIVVTKRTVVRERIIVRKQTLVEQFVVDTELRTEQLEIQADPPELAEQLRSSIEAQRGATDEH